MKIKILTITIATLLSIGCISAKKEPDNLPKKMALQAAVESRNTNEVVRLLRNGVDPNQRYNGVPAVVTAIRLGDIETFTVLTSDVRFKAADSYIEKIQDPKTKTTIRIRQAAIADAIRAKNVEMVQKLISRGANIDISITRAVMAGDSVAEQLASSHPLLLALGNEYSEDNYKIADLVESRMRRTDVRVAAPTQLDPTATQHIIQAALLTYHDERYNPILQRLFNRGGYRVTYLEKISSAEAKHIERTQGEAALIYTRKYLWQSWLDYAIDGDNVGMVKYFLDLKVKTFRANDKGAVLMMKSGNVEIIKLFVESGININQGMPETGETVLMRHYADMSPEDFAKLIEMGADCRLTDSEGRNILQRAEGKSLTKQAKKNLAIVRQIFADEAKAAKAKAKEEARRAKEAAKAKQKELKEFK